MSNLPRARKASRRFAIGVLLSFGFAAGGFAAANLFPDETWRIFNASRNVYGELVSRITPIPSGTDRSVQECKIYESLIRDLAGPNRVVFLRVDGSDPTDDVMLRLNASGLIVKRASEASFNQALDRYVDRSSQERGVLVQVGSIKWVFGDRVEVKGGLYCGHLCGEGGIFRLLRVKSRWEVEECRDRWVA